MDPQFAEQGRAPGRGGRTSDRGLNNRQQSGGNNANQSQCIDRGHGLQAGSRPSRKGWCAICGSAGLWRKSGSIIASAWSADRCPPAMSTSSRSSQVPCFSDGTVKIFESGAIVQYIGEKSEALLPQDPQARFRAIQWTYAALNSVEPAILNVSADDRILRRRGVGEAAPPRRRGLCPTQTEARVRLARRQALARGRPVHHRRPHHGRPCCASSGTPEWSPSSPISTPT